METTFLGYWIFLDFLGFSRLNRAFSMGYTGFSLDHFHRGFSPLRLAGAGACGRGQAGAQDCSLGELNSFLIFFNRFFLRLKFQSSSP
jgi:hypothetical protein